MRMSSGDEPIQRKITPLQPLQRKCEECENETEHRIQRAGKGQVGLANSEFQNSLITSKGSGSPLGSDTRQFMESRIDADFSHVKIHTGSTAAQMNRDISARAFTHGSDIYFNQNQYNPASSSGKQLLAHELTHVIQQGEMKNHSGDLTVSSPPTGHVQRKLAVDTEYNPVLEEILNANGLRKNQDAAAKLSGDERVAQVKPAIEALCPAFSVKAGGQVEANDTDSGGKPSASDHDASKNPVACCCLHVMTNPDGSDWKILISDLVSPQTIEEVKVIIIPTETAPIDYGNWPSAPSEERNFYDPKIVLGHEMCGHASLMELEAHPGNASRLTTDVHDPTVNIENAIALEQGGDKDKLRGLARSGRHRGESFARIVISKYPINQISPFSIPDKKEQEKLFIARNLIKANDFFVDLRGHTDPSGTDEINDRISKQRATAVRAFLLGKVTAQRHLDRRDDTTPLVDRFGITEGVRDKQPPKEGTEDPANWRRVEIFMASFPAGTEKPPEITPDTVDTIEPNEKAKKLAKGGDPCEKRLVTSAYPKLAKKPASTPAIRIPSLAPLELIMRKS